MIIEISNLIFSKKNNKKIRISSSTVLLGFKGLNAKPCFSEYIGHLLS